jgi:hypothetical protein
MKPFHRAAAFFAVLFSFLQPWNVWGHGATVADDPYAPLRLYNGKWQLISGDKKAPTNIENHCAQTGVFYSCEQIVDGKTAALVVFLPMAKTKTGGEEYRTHVLTPDAKPSGDWHDLTIEGDKWFYTWDSTEAGKKVFWRNVNTFSGPDKSISNFKALPTAPPGKRTSKVTSSASSDAVSGSVSRYRVN